MGGLVEPGAKRQFCIKCGMETTAKEASTIPVMIMKSRKAQIRMQTTQCYCVPLFDFGEIGAKDKEETRCTVPTNE